MPQAKNESDSDSKPKTEKRKKRKFITSKLCNFCD